MIGCSMDQSFIINWVEWEVIRPTQKSNNRWQFDPAGHCHSIRMGLSSCYHQQFRPGLCLFPAEDGCQLSPHQRWNTAERQCRMHYFLKQWVSGDQPERWFYLHRMTSFFYANSRVTNSNLHCYWVTDRSLLGKREHVPSVDGGPEGQSHFDHF